MAGQASIKLVNADNGRVITQLTEADFRELHWLADDLGGPEHQPLAEKVALFAAFLDGTNQARGRRSSSTRRASKASTRRDGDGSAAPASTPAGHHTPDTHPPPSPAS